MISRKRLSLILLLLWLSACGVNDTKDEASVFYSIPVGSLLVLNQPVTISADQVAVYVQDGKLMRYKAVDKYRPNCKFEIYTMSEQPRTVNEDSFEIIRVVDEIESSSLQQDIHLAMRDSVLAYGILDRGYMFNYATKLYLHSDKQEDVYRMTCQHWEDMLDNRYVTVPQMRAAMGDIFTLVIKNAGAPGQGPQ